MYWGPSENAISFFISSPLGFDFSLYNNPVDFITDISSCSIHGKTLRAEDLKNNFDLNEMGIRNSRNLEKYFASIEKGNRISEQDQVQEKFISFSTPTTPRSFCSKFSCNLLSIKLKKVCTYEYWDESFFKKRFLFVRYS